MFDSLEDIEYMCEFAKYGTQVYVYLFMSLWLCGINILYVSVVLYVSVSISICLCVPLFNFALFSAKLFLQLSH